MNRTSSLCTVTHSDKVVLWLVWGFSPSSKGATSTIMGLNRLIVDHLDSVVSCSGLAGPGLCAKLPHSSQDSEMHGGYGRLYASKRYGAKF